jgi:hypothetical protein
MLNRVQRSSHGQRLFLAFPDGVYHHVCSECTALCCRGHGFGGSLRREIGTLLQLYPSLASAAASRQGDVLTFHTPPTGCCFLEPDNLCGLEKRHGRGLKPGICALFPFNVFTRIGSTIAISPHFLCPLRLELPPKRGTVEGTHDRIEAAARESGLLERGYVDAMAPATLHPSANARSVLRREAIFRDRCEAGLGRERFAEVLRDASDSAGALDAFVVRAARILALDGGARAPQRDRVDDLLLAIAPPLRLSLLALSGEAMLQALALGERLVRCTLSLHRDAPTLQTVHGAMSDTLPVLRLLARGDETLELAEGSEKGPPLPTPELTFAAYLALREARGAAGLLAALEQAITPELSAADRLVLLRHLARRVAHAKHPRG